MNENEMVRAKVTVTVDQDLISWVDKLIEEKKYRNRSHAVEYALYALRIDLRKIEASKPKG